MAASVPVPSQNGVPRPEAIPRAPTLGGALRAGASDLFYNSWRVVPANVVLGAGLILVLWAWASLGPVVAAVVAAPLAAPLSGLFRLGAMATRGRDVNLSDVLDPVRAEPLPILAAGGAFALAALVLVTNVASGLLIGGVLAWAIATAALWGIVLLVMLGFALWPLVVDPVRAGTPFTARARLAGLLVLAHPGRMGGLALLLAGILAASTVVVVALLTVSVGLVALVACRYVLPAADRLEVLLAQRDSTGVGAGTIDA